MFPKVRLILFIFYPLLLVYKIFGCNCLQIDTRNLERPGKNLCEIHYQDVNCSNQIRSELHHANCLMKYLNQTSTDCSDSEFVGESDEKNMYGAVNITPYPWFDNGFIFPALNITFTQIQWQNLRIRFVKVGSITPQICREFVLSEEIDPSSIISFDCLWGNGATAGEHYRFQYVLANREGHKFLNTYLLQIPKDTDVDKYAASESYSMFMVVDQTTLPLVRLRLMVPPSRLNLTTSNIKLFYKQDLQSSSVVLKHWIIDLKKKQEGDFILVGPYDTDNSPGYYYFNASVNCITNCTESSTPLLQIKGVKHGIEVTCAIVLLVASVLGLAGFTMWKNKYKKIVYDGEKQPNVLLIYESSYPSHIENIYKFKEFIQDNCYVNPKLDLIDIPKTDSKNPWTWYYNAFKEADYVLVFASPKENTDKGIHEDNVYHNLHTYALKLLVVYLLHKHKFLVASIKLPGCSWDTLPHETFIIDKRFSLPEKLSHLFKFLNVPPVPNGSSMLVAALQQPWRHPGFTVSRPVAPLRLPFDQEDFDLENEVREPLSVKGIVLDLDGQSTSEEEYEEREDVENSQHIAELRL